MTQSNSPQNVIVDSGAAAIGDGSKAVGVGGIYVEQNTGHIHNNLIFNGTLPIAQLQQLRAQLQRPSIDELFKVAREPERIFSSLFYSASSDRLSVDQIPYVANYRTGEC